MRKEPDPMSNTSLKQAARAAGEKNVTREKIRQRMGREKINPKQNKKIKE